MKRLKLLKKPMAVCLALLMLIPPSMAVLTINAAGASDGVCEHHQVHTAECGYVEAVAGSPCNHEHDSACGYAPVSEEVPCNMSCIDNDSDGIIDHVPECAYQPGSEGSPCMHSHDKNCGYIEAVVGSPCIYKCEICSALSNGINTFEDTDENVQLSSVAVLTEAISTQEVSLGTSLESLNLPTELNAVTAEGTDVTITGVIWEATPAYTGGTAGTYLFTAVLPQGYVLVEGAELPKITVTVKAVEPAVTGTLSEVYWNATSGDDNNDGTTGTTAVKTFEKAKELLAGDGTIYVCAPVYVSGSQTWSLEGYGNAKLQRTSLLGHLIVLEENAALTLEHIVIDGNADVLAQSSIAGDELIRADEASTLILGNGCVLQNNQANAMGAAIAGWNKLHLIMEEGAVIQNNHTTGAHYGGGVFLANGSTFEMNGGEIKNNEANRGGGVSLIGSSMEMSGGSISENRTYDVSNDAYGGYLYRGL